MSYWFKPARLGKWIAVYYPSSLAGLIVTLVLLTAAIKFFIFSDTLISFLPWLLVLMLVYDLLCFRRGLYPWWWRNKKEK